MDTKMLRGLYSDLYGPPAVEEGKLKFKMKNITELTQTLNAVTKREKSWTPGYIYNLLTDKPNFRITPELEQVINIIAGRRDEAHPLQSLRVKIEHVYSINGNIKSGDFISGHRRQCACLVWFVPHSNLQRYCCPECPARPKRK